MKTNIGITSVAATVIVNCIVQVAKDHGFTIPEEIQDQLSTIVLSLIALGGLGFTAWAHHSTKEVLTQQIQTLTPTQGQT